MVKGNLSGYIQKKIGKKIEDFKTYWDGSVRDSLGNIISFLYGGDGMHAKKLMYAQNYTKPIFIDPKILASLLTTDYELSTPHEKRSNKLKFNKEIIDQILTYIKAGCPGVQTEVTERATYNFKVVIRALLIGLELYEDIIPKYCKQLVDHFEKAKAPADLMAGLIASSSIGEPTTQLSVLSTEQIPLMIIKNEQKEYYQGDIGQKIDEIINDCDEFILAKHSIIVNPPYQVYTMTVNTSTEKCEWKLIQEISRHKVCGDMITVYTKSGRNISTTLAHSHLKRKKNGTIVSIRGDQLNIGDFIPVCYNMKNEIQQTYVTINDELTKTTRDVDLDFDFGWLFGAYLAEGFVNNGQICITNVSKHFENRCRKIAKKFGGEVRTKSKHNSIIIPEQNICKGDYPEYLSTTHHISGISDIGRYLVEQCESGSENKKTPDFALHAPLKFVKGLLRGYFDGDGNVNPSRDLIRVHSISKRLIDQICLLLNRFGIFSTVGIEKPNRDFPLHRCCILRKHTPKFLKSIGSDFKEKLKGINEIIQHLNNKTHSTREDIDKIPYIGDHISRIAKPLKLPGYSRTYKRWEKKTSIGRETLRNYIDAFEERAKELETKIDLKLLKNAVNSDIIWDEIIYIDIYTPDQEEFVYDLGVSGNHTFMLQSGIFTHNTLNTFHAAGIAAKDVTLGVPRLKELLNATKKQSKPTMTIYLDEKIVQDRKLQSDTIKKAVEKLEQQQKNIKDEKISKAKQKLIDESKKSLEILEDEFSYECTMMGEKIVCVRIDELLKKSKESPFGWELKYIPSDPLIDQFKAQSPLSLITYEEYEPSWWITLAHDLKILPANAIKAASWVIILKLDVEKLFTHSITVEEVAIKIEEEAISPISAVASPNIIGEIEIYINFDNTKKYIETKLQLPLGDDTSTRETITDHNVNFFTARDVAMSFIKEVKVNGIRGIGKTFPRKDETGEWIIDTQNLKEAKSGSPVQTLLDVLGLKGIDPKRTISDNPWEILKVLGIESAREFLYKEVEKVLSFDNTYINPRHIEILVDSMCRTGTITSVNRDGIGKDVGPIAKGMFETTVTVFADAAAFGEHDNLEGVSASVMFGAKAKIGSGNTKISDQNSLPAKK